MRLKSMGTTLGAILVVAAWCASASDAKPPIKLGQTIPYSGPGSTYSIYGHVQTAYFRMVNDAGGINGRQIELLSKDDGYSPPKTVEVTRQLVEQDEVLAIAGSNCTACQNAVAKYLNVKGVPQLFLPMASPFLLDHVRHPLTIPFTLDYYTEGRIYAKYLLESRPSDKIAVLYQNDDLGRSLLSGFKSALGDKANLIVKESSYESTDATIDSQIVNLKASGATVFANFSMGKFSVQAIRKLSDIGWKPLHILPSVSNSISQVLTPAGLDRSKGAITSRWFKTVGDDTTGTDKDIKAFREFMAKYAPNQDVTDTIAVYAYLGGELTRLVLEKLGNDVTRENLVREAKNLENVTLPMLLHGITISSSPKDHRLIQKTQLFEFNGTAWQPLGNVVSAN